MRTKCHCYDGKLRPEVTEWFYDVPPALRRKYPPKDLEGLPRNVVICSRCGKPLRRHCTPVLAPGETVEDHEREKWVADAPLRF